MKDEMLTVFAGAASRAGSDIMLILCLSVCLSILVFERISRPLIGKKLGHCQGQVS